ncbi:MAG: COX15/CtaA family protein [Gammaproteobacteria bacterium]|nr:COX15/CtaA family protein [Gammaproteobacteria bacterium]
MTSSPRPAAPTDRALVAWLALCCALVFATVVLGAAVRLTGSGLSMVDWRPLAGALPPLDAEAWRRAFAAYRQFPEYRLVNPDMTLAGFQFIFWFEYAHRLLGRVIGVVFLLPFLFFLAAGRVSGALGVRLWALFGLGAAQGLLGWYMVQSGLAGAPQVSPYRLALHFMLAAGIYAWMLRVTVGVARRRPAVDSATTVAGTVTATVAGKIAVTVILLTMLSGALVAGRRAGFAYNTWPLFDGAWIPAHLFALRPWWLNFTDNIVTIQFAHRWLAFLALAAAAGFAWRLIRDGVRDGGDGVRDGGGDAVRDGVRDGGDGDNRGNRTNRTDTLAGYALLTVAAAQVMLGIATLLLRVPPALGVAHQAGAMLLLTVTVAALATRLPPLPAAPRPRQQ